MLSSSPTDLHRRPRSPGPAPTSPQLEPWTDLGHTPAGGAAPPAQQQQMRGVREGCYTCILSWHFLFSAVLFKSERLCAGACSPVVTRCPCKDPDVNTTTHCDTCTPQDASLWSNPSESNMYHTMPLPIVAPALCLDRGSGGLHACATCDFLQSNPCSPA